MEFAKDPKRPSLATYRHALGYSAGKAYRIEKGCAMTRVQRFSGNLWVGYSIPNAAWIVGWGNTVLGFYQTRREAIDEIKYLSTKIGE